MNFIITKAKYSGTDIDGFFYEVFNASGEMIVTGQRETMAELLIEVEYHLTRG